MEDYTYTNLLSGYKERVLRITLFDIFAQLDTKQLKDEHNKPIDFFGLGLLSLLFFFESMLLRIKNRGVKELAEFLIDMTGNKLYSEKEEYEKLARLIVEAFRPAGGRRNARRFYNYETHEWDEVEYALLKADDWDVHKNIQYYTLDEQGLELIFATKEYFSEFQISISQMMLRKQLEKGEFYGALRQVDEMRISVNAIRENIHRIKHDIQRNITSEDTYNRYKELIQDINKRLANEEHEFVELTQFIKETKSFMDGPSEMKGKDQTAMEMLVRIDNELAHVHYLHSNLLKDSIELKTSALDAAAESLYYAGITAFNFDAELARKVTNVPIPLMETKVLVKPYLSLKQFRAWSPVAVFAPQQRESTNKTKNDMIYIETVDVSTVKADERRSGLTKAMGLIRAGMSTSGPDSRLMISQMAENEKLQPYMDTREFAELCVMMHQMSPLDVKEILSQEEHILYDGIKAYFEQETYVYAEELSEVVPLGEHYEIKNLEIRTGGRNE